MDTTTIQIIFGVIAVFVFLPVFIVPYWKIFSKAGFSGVLSLLMIVPLVSLIVLYCVAFSKWKGVGTTCVYCGKALIGEGQFCAHCGKATIPA